MALVMLTDLLAFMMSAIDAFSERMRLGLKHMARLLADILLCFSFGRTSLIKNSNKKAIVIKFSFGSP